MKNIPFIPRIKDDKVIKVTEAIIDELDFADIIGKDILIKYMSPLEKVVFDRI